MKTPMPKPELLGLDRRSLLKGLGSLAAGAQFAPGVSWAQASSPDPKFLIVIAGAGGASIVDAMLAVRASEAGSEAASLNTFPDAQVSDVEDSPFRAVRTSNSSVGAIPFPYAADQRPFVQKWKNDLMVVTQTGTSVNHQVAQKRSLTGNDAFNGRTLQEAVAAHYGQDFPLPNVNMSGGGYVEPGIDATLPAFARSEPVAEASLWPLSLHGSRGVAGAPSASRIALARGLRDQQLDPQSVFHRTFSANERLQLWQAQREAQLNYEQLDLITKLNALPNVVNSIPLEEYGLEESPDGAKVRQAFPKFLEDPFEAQAALAFLLIKNRVSVTVTISPSFAVLLQTEGFGGEVINPPLAFDYSHNAHRDGQALMWDRILSVGDRLATLLQGEEYGDGQSFWDRSMIYFATEFGRSRNRPAGSTEFGSGHDLNNGYAVLSPLANGGKVLGGVDPQTTLTYGFDPEDPAGIPMPGTHMAERQIYAGLLHALEVPTQGLPNMRAMRKKA